MGLEVEDVVDGGVSGEELLGGALALEFLLLTLPSSDGEMRVFGAIVGPHASRPVSARQPEDLRRSSIGCELVRHDGLWADALIAEQLSKQFQGRRLVPALLDQNVENFAFVIDSAPKPHALAADPGGHLVQMPASRRAAAGPTH